MVLGLRSFQNFDSEFWFLKTSASIEQFRALVELKDFRRRLTTLGLRRALFSFLTSSQLRGNCGLCNRQALTRPTTWRVPKRCRALLALLANLAFCFCDFILPGSKCARSSTSIFKPINFRPKGPKSLSPAHRAGWPVVAFLRPEGQQ